MPQNSFRFLTYRVLLSSLNPRALSLSNSSPPSTRGDFCPGQSVFLSFFEPRSQDLDKYLLVLVRGVFYRSFAAIFLRSVRSMALNDSTKDRYSNSSISTPPLPFFSVVKSQNVTPGVSAFQNILSIRKPLWFERISSATPSFGSPVANYPSFYSIADLLQAFRKGYPYGFSISAPANYFPLRLLPSPDFHA